MFVPFAVFGPGSLYVRRTDLANSTPINIGYAQEFSLEESAENKELFGQKQYPLVVARGTIKVSGKAKAAMISPVALNNAYYGEADIASGGALLAQAEAHAVPATPFAVTVTHAADFIADLGVLVSATGQPLERVASAPITGQYSVDEVTGIYTFAAADTTVAMLFTYAYSTTSGDTLVVTNKEIGNTPTFEIWYTTSLNARPYTLHIFQAVASKLSQQFKITDFMMPEIDFGIFANSAGNVYEAFYPE